MRSPGRRVGGAFLVLALIAAGTGASSCSPSTDLPASAELRSPVARDGGMEITVPALWADSSAGTSGIEPARVWASRDGAAAFRIELTDLKAKGAGPQWLAASNSAAAVGSMGSGIDPGRVDVSFTITGPIDGPSAGGILTVGVLAALLGTPIRGDVTMTGTISPDGSIGPIGGTDLKLRAAAEQGYRTVLLPIPNMLVRDAVTGQQRSATDVGRELGLDVVPVANVQQAYTIFTDGKYSYPSAPAFALPESVRVLTGRQADELLARVVKDSAGLPTSPTADTIRSLLTQAQQAQAAGDSALAYGLGMLSLNITARAQASQDMRDVIANEGTVAAAQRLGREITSAISRNDEALALASEGSTSLGYEQLIALPNALSWLAYNQAILAVLDKALTDEPAPTKGQLDRAARILADVDLAIDVYYPNQLAVVRTSPAKPSPGESVMATYLSKYTEFLIGAGRANEDYARTVVLRGQDPAVLEAENDVGLLLPVAGYLGSAVSSIPVSTDSIPDEMVQATTAVTYYIATASLIASVQDFGIDEFGIGADPVGADRAVLLASSVRFAKQTVDQVSALLAQRGLDASLPVWAAEYGTATATALAKSPKAAAANVLALNELYFDVITVFMLQTGPLE